MLVIIPTHNRSGLLDRTLASLSQCVLPQVLRGIVVLENGKKTPDSEDIVSKYQNEIPLVYDYDSEPNKSRSLNIAIDKYAQDELVVFFDDDVRLSRDVLMVYAAASASRREGTFYAGWVGIDYEDPDDPPAWIVPFLPACSIGWDFGNTACKLDHAYGLGFNWAAYSKDIVAAGGFNEAKGPGARTNSIGQETDMQIRFLSKGVEGQYLPDAKVWHFVEKGRCSPEWVLRYAYRHGIARGLDLHDDARMIAGMPLWAIKSRFQSEVSCVWRRCTRKDHRAILAMQKHREIMRGLLKGSRLREKNH